MSTTMLLLLIFLWWLSGFASFCYWWTTDHDLTTGMLVYGATVPGLIGPVSFLVGYCVHGGRGTGDSKVWLKRREK